MMRSGNFVFIFFVLIGLTFIPGCATKQHKQQQQKDLDELLASKTFAQEVGIDESGSIDERKYDQFLEMIRTETDSSKSTGSGAFEEEDGAKSAALGLQELGKIAQDPTLLAEALKDLQDPSIQQEVQALMKDPAFKREMKQLLDSPTFKAAMSRAATNLEQLAENPELMEKMKLMSEVHAGNKEL